MDAIWAYEDFSKRLMWVVRFFSPWATYILDHLIFCYWRSLVYFHILGVSLPVLSIHQIIPTPNTPTNIKCPTGESLFLSEKEYLRQQWQNKRPSSASHQTAQHQGRCAVSSVMDDVFQPNKCFFENIYYVKSTFLNAMRGLSATN